MELSGKKIWNSIPSPGELARKQKKVKVTISLSSSTIDFFKKEADEHGTKYQRLIRAVLDEYVSQNEQNNE